jgi:phosphatidate cytidylyltransferase
VPERTGGGSGEGEDLFEDLDKFFAPIQDVDWPETSGPETSEPESTRAGGTEPAEGDRAEMEDDIADLREVEEPTAQTPGQEDLFAASEPPRDDEDDDASPSTGAGFLFGEEPDLAEDEAITEEAFAQAPPAYVELPGADDEDDTSVAELLEDDGTAPEPAPGLDEVEAAADHFAESVRDEVSVEPDAGGGQPTEEVQLSALLGEDVEDEDEDAYAPARTVRVGPEGLGGPSWQEPTALEVGAEPERRGPGRDVPLAFLTGLALAAVTLGAIALGTGVFAVLAGAIVLFAQGEFYFALQKRHYQPATALGLVSGALVLAAGYYRGEEAMVAMVALGTIASFLWYMTVPVQHRRNVVTNIALTVLGIVYIPMLAAYALSVLRFPDGRGLAVAIIGLTIAYDVAAFAVGYFWGSRPLAPNVSPKKSWEGAIGATLVVIAVAVGAVAPAVGVLDTVARSVGLAVVVAIFAPLGDLAESLLKRDLGLKDMGSVLPGHGGVLDRIDAILFVAPAAVLFLRLILAP